ncbi:MAG: hypothetical protein BRC41_03970 [Cyanobacteria bacterium QH_9_48_43]|nr:MAG: hypothetical protein BRC41_03970 [Cyanobacteria bacterium QH_9_48_43]
MMQNNQLVERTMVPGLHEHLIQSIPETVSHDTPILDIGCGTGAWLERLADAGFNHLYGLDQNIQQFRTRKASCYQTELESNDLGFEDKKFGFITSIEVIEHLQNPGKLFYHVSNLLERQGYFLLTTPNLESVLCKLRLLLTGNLRQFDPKGEPTHIYPVFITTLKRILTMHGLEVVQQWSFPSNTSVTSRASLKIMSSLLSLAISDPFPGDILCLLIQKK